jgi:hypothetical protein
MEAGVMEKIAPNWTVYGLSLAAALIFGIIFAMVVRWASKRQMVAQTAFAVVVGVTATLLIATPFFGVDVITYLFPYFIAAGLPMIFEYVLRIEAAIRKDKERAQDVAKDFLK